MLNTAIFQGLSEAEVSEAIRNMPPKDRAEFESLVLQIEESRRINPAMHFKPTEPQRSALDMLVEKDSVFAFGGNSSGKTYLGSHLGTCFLLGYDPSGIVPAGVIPPVCRDSVAGIAEYTKVWLCSTKVSKGIDMFKQYIQRMLPKGSWTKPINSDGAFTMKNGASLQVMSYDSAVEQFQSDTVHLVLMDEQPPKPIYDECLARIHRIGGKIFCMMTPLNENATWTYWDIIENERGDETVGYVVADIDSNFYLDQKLKNKFINSYKGTSDEAPRLHGIHSMAQGIIHKEFRKEIHVVEPIPLEKLMGDGFRFGYVLDVHTRTGDVGMFFAYRMEYDPTVYVIDEFEMDENDSIKELGVAVEDHTGFLKSSIHDEAAQPGFVISRKLIDCDDTDKADKGGTNIWIEMSRVGIVGVKANRSFSNGRQRFEDYLRKPAFFVFNTCTGTIRSVRNLHWDNWKVRQAESREKKQKHVHKDDHHARNCHYIALSMPALNKLRERPEKEKGAATHRSPLHTQNYLRKTG